MRASLRILRVADRPELAEVVAGWHVAEWGHLTPTLSLADRVRGVLGAAAGTYVARDRDRHGPPAAGAPARMTRRKGGLAVDTWEAPSCGLFSSH